MKLSKPLIVGAAFAAVAAVASVSVSIASDSEAEIVSELEELFADDEHEIEQPLLANNEF